MSKLTIETINEMKSHLDKAMTDKSQFNGWSSEDIFQWVDDQAWQFVADIDELDDDELHDDFCDVRNDAAYAMIQQILES